MSRLVLVVAVVGLFGACSGDTEPVESSQTDPTRDFDVQEPALDTDWPLGLREDTDTEDTDTDTGDSDTAEETDTDAG